MHTTKRIARLLAAGVTTMLLLSACTPEQLDVYQKVTGDQLDAGRTGALLALDDTPWRLDDGTVIQVDGTLTPPTACDLEKTRINTMVYHWGVSEPAMNTFRSVARCRGWTQPEIDSWLTAAEDIMRGESGFCWNVLGGARGAGAGCVIARQGRKEDAGFGQLIRIHYQIGRPGTGWLCVQEGLCSKWDVIATPWNSMTALVALIERSGTAGWCFSASARRHHRTTCGHPGIDVG